MADNALQPSPPPDPILSDRHLTSLPAALLVGTYEKVLFGFALHIDTPKGAPRFTPLFTAPGHLETIKSVAANAKVRSVAPQSHTM